MGFLLSAYLRADWREQLAEQGPDRRPFSQRLQENIRRELREMRAAGVHILAGTDIGVLNVAPGESLHEELRLLVRDANLSPLDALRAATHDAAAFLRREAKYATTGSCLPKSETSAPHLPVAGTVRLPNGERQ